MHLFRVITLSFTLLLGGCFSLPQWRVAQAKVPEPIIKTTQQIEGERQAAFLLADKIEKPEALKPVARALSVSLGSPKEPIKDTPKAPEVALEALQAGMRKQQEQLAQLNTRLAKYQGKEIEDTGVNLFAPASGLGLVGLVAACIFVPGFLTFLLFFIRRLYATISFMVEKIQEFHPAEDAPIKQALGRSMDSTHKAIVKSVRAKLVKGGVC